MLEVLEPKGADPQPGSAAEPSVSQRNVRPTPEANGDMRFSFKGSIKGFRV